MKRIFSALLIATLGLTLLTGCSDNATSTEPPEVQAVAVSITEIQRSSIENLRTVVGKTQPVQEVSVFAKMPGTVTQVNAEVGQPVSKGDMLFSVEDEDIRLQVQQAQAGLNSARANLARTSGGSVELQLAQLKSSLLQAELMFKDAQTALDSARILYDAGAVSKFELDSTETRFRTAQAQYETAKKAVELTESTINKENAAIASAQVQQAQASYDLAQNQLENARVTAPISGIVSVRNATKGELISGAVPAFTLVDLSTVVVEISVMQELVNSVTMGETVELKIEAAGGSGTYTGKVTAISPSADPRTQAYLIKIEVPNTDGRIKGGMLATVNLTTDARAEALVVPMDAVLDDNGKSIVYVVEGDMAVRREVTAGLSNGEFVEVSGGIAEGDKVIVKGQNYLQDKSKITVVD